MDETDGPPGPTISRRIPAGRAWYRFLRDPSSVRRALRVIIAANLTVVVIAGLLIWLLDPKDYPNVGLAFWYILQTVTTVGYGDATPTEPLGRLLGAIVMLTAIGFLSIITASITSAFVDARQAARRAPVDVVEAEHRARLEARLDELFARLDAIERRGRDRPT